MSKWEIFKLFQEYDSEISEADFSPEELRERLKSSKGGFSDWKEEYFSYYDDVKDKSLKKQDW